MADATQRELSYRKRLIEIANLINSAPSIQDDPGRPQGQDPGPGGRRARHDLRARHQEPGAVLAVQGRPGGARRSASRRPSRSIAGFTALSRKTANIKNAYDAAELTRLHPNLRFDSRWDKASGFRRAQVLAVPDPVREVPAGRAPAHQQARRRRRSRPKDEEAAEELAQDPRHRLLQPAPRRAQQQALEVRRCWSTRASLREGHREGGLGNARVNQIDVAKVLIEDYKVPKEEIGRALGAVLQLRRSGSPPGADARPT